MEKSCGAGQALSFSEEKTCLKTIRKYKLAPFIIGYIFFETNPINLRELVSLLQSEGFDDIGIALVFLGGMQECISDTAAVLKDITMWNEGRVELAVARAKLYYLYYSKPKKQKK